MRGKQSPKRPVKPDAVYNSELVSKFINYVMYDGKKAVAEGIIYDAIDHLNRKTKTQGIEVLEKAIGNVKPKIEVRSRRIGGANFQVPVPVSNSRQISLALRWIIDAARSARKNTTFAETLSNELMNAFNNEGTAVKKKEEVHRMAEANRAFAQFA